MYIPITVSNYQTLLTITFKKLFLNKLKNNTASYRFKINLEPVRDSDRFNISRSQYKS